MAKQYSVSYMVLREAMQGLQREGLVLIRQGAGIFYLGEEAGSSAAAGPKPFACGRTRRIGVVLPDWSQRYGYGPVWEVVNGLMGGGAWAEPWRFELIPCYSHRSTVPEFGDELHERGLDGLAWLWPRYGHQLLMARLAERGVEIVSCIRRFPHSGIPCVTFDLMHSARLLMRWCAENGLQRLAIFCAPFMSEWGDPYGLDMVSAIEPAAAEFGVQLPAEGAFQVIPPQNQQVPEEDFVRAHPEVQAYLCLFQRHIPPLANLAKAGYWADPREVAVLDPMHHFGLPSSIDLQGLRYVRLLNPYRALGMAMARHFEQAWNPHGAPLSPAPDLRPEIEEIQ